MIDPILEERISHLETRVRICCDRIEQMERIVRALDNSNNRHSEVLFKMLTAMERKHDGS